LKLQNITPDEIKIIILAAGVIIAGAAVLHHRNFAAGAPRVVRNAEQDSAPPRQKKDVVVDVSGAVWRPGVYALPEGARVEDVLEKAMLRPDADIDSVNRARILHDGQKLVVPSVSAPSGSAREEEEAYIDINSADVRALQELPAIGESRARDIVDYRKKHGPFSSVDELTNIAGIGEATVERLKERATAR
jgi:competence protein ComEA